MTDIKTNPIIDDAIHRASLSQDKLIFFKEHKVLTFLLTISGIGLLYLALVGYESYKASKNLKEKAVTQIANDAEFDRIAAVLRKCNISPQRVLESQQIKALFDPSKYQTIQRQLKRLEDPRSQTSIDKLLDQSVSLSLQIFEAETKKPDLTPFLVCLYSQDEDEEISDLLKSKKNLDFLLSRVEIERSSLPTSEELQKFYPRFKQIMDSNYFNLNRMNLDPSLPEIRKFELTRKQWTSKLLLQKPSDPATVLASFVG